jgi:hypothetical protein
MCSVPEAEVTRHQGESDTGDMVDVLLLSKCVGAPVCEGSMAHRCRGSLYIFVAILKDLTPCDLHDRREAH